MKIMFLVSFTLLLSSCSFNHGKRHVASIENNLTGTRIGVVTYRTKKWVNVSNSNGDYAEEKRELKTFVKKRAVRLYLHPIEKEVGSYHLVLLEYVNLLKMAPSYISSNKLPGLVHSIRWMNFLNQISKKATVYKVTPTSDESVYDMQKLKVVGNKIEAEKAKEHSQLILSSDSPSMKSKLHSMDGARITASNGGESAEIYFPAPKEKGSFGEQYTLAQFVYRAAELESTWRKDFLSGPYLGSYGDKKDEVLRLSKDGDEYTANFKLNKKRSHFSRRRREKQFTNKKSAYLEGEYTVSEPEDGMFIFNKKGSSHKGAEYVEGQIGLFIDIFDARKKLGQDVVELILINRDDPEDFLMYYEHPDNGEGEN